MGRRAFVVFASMAAALAFSSCSKEIAYNSNSGYDGSRDSAAQLLVNTSKVDDLSAPEGDNEDWFYFMPPENGIVKVRAHVDSPDAFIVKISVLDGFGRTLKTLTSNNNDNVYEFPPIEVTAERYFISMVTTQGRSAYTIRADFEVPPVIEIVQPEPQEEAPPQTAAPASRRPSCVPADRCKPGQRCCKAPAVSDDEISPTEKTVKGTIVLVTPQTGEISDVKINGIGSKNGVKKGAKAYLRGLKRKVDIYSCKTVSCQATIRATSEELTHYDTVDVVVQ